MKRYAIFFVVLVFCILTVTVTISAVSILGAHAEELNPGTISETDDSDQTYLDPRDTDLVDIEKVSFLRNELHLFIILTAYSGFLNSWLRDGGILINMDIDQDPSTGETTMLVLSGLSPDYSIHIGYNPEDGKLEGILFKWLGAGTPEAVEAFPVLHDDGDMVVITSVPGDLIPEFKQLDWSLGAHSTSLIGEFWDMVPDTNYDSYYASDLSNLPTSNSGFSDNRIVRARTDPQDTPGINIRWTAPKQSERNYRPRVIYLNYGEYIGRGPTFRNIRLKTPTGTLPAKLSIMEKTLAIEPVTFPLPANRKIIVNIPARAIQDMQGNQTQQQFTLYFYTGKRS